MSKEELGRLVASRWTGEKSDKPTEADDSPKTDDKENHEHTPNTPHEVDEDHGFISDDDEDTRDDGKYSDHEPEDDSYEEEYRHDASSSSYKSETDDYVDFSGLHYVHRCLYSLTMLIIYHSLHDMIEFRYG